MKFLLLALAGAVYGFLGGALFRRVHLRGEINRILAHVLSFRVFIDEPVLVFRAQVELLRETLRVLRTVAVFRAWRVAGGAADGDHRSGRNRAAGGDSRGESRRPDSPVA